MAASTAPSLRKGLSIAHMGMLELAPPAVVECAATAGFAHVNLRIAAARENETPFPMSPGSPMLRETISRMDDTGVAVHDVEVIRIAPDTRASDNDQFFDTAAALGARRIIAISVDDDASRATASLAALCDRAAPLKLSIDLEFMVFTAVKSLEAATSIVTASAAPNAGVLVDTLHLHRSGGSAAHLAAIPPHLLRFVQICDAPLMAPDNLVHEARHARLLPGEGELPLADILRALPADIQIGIEVPLDGARGLLPALRRAELTRSAANALLKTLTG